MGQRLYRVAGEEFGLEQLVAALRLLQQRIVGLVRQRQHGGKHAVLRESEERVVLLHPLIQAAGAGGHSGVLRGRHRTGYHHGGHRQIGGGPEMLFQRIVHLQRTVEALFRVIIGGHHAEHHRLACAAEVGKQPGFFFQQIPAALEPVGIGAGAAAGEHGGADGIQRGVIPEEHGPDDVPILNEIGAEPGERSAHTKPSFLDLLFSIPQKRRIRKSACTQKTRESASRFTAVDSRVWFTDTSQNQRILYESL